MAGSQLHQGSSGQYAYDYDLLGNRTLWQDLASGQSEAYTIESTSNRLLDKAGTGYTYDAMGNPTQIGDKRLSYNAQGRLSTVETPSGRWDYTYNLDGQRLVKAHEGERHWFHYGPDGQLLAELDHHKQPVREYLYLNGQRLAMSVHSTNDSLVQSATTAGEQWQSVALEAGSAPQHLIAGLAKQTDSVGIVQVQNSGTEAAIRFKSWGEADTTTRHIPLLALPEGRHAMRDGSIWEVGQVTLSDTNQWEKVNLSQTLPGTPSIFLTVQGEALEPTLTPRLSNITPDSFQQALQEEGERQGPTPTTITWLALYSPTGEGTVSINGQTATYQLTHANLINTGWTAIEENDYRLRNEPNGPPEQISETVALLTLDGQAFGQIQSLNHCDKVITLASREDKPSAGESGLYFLHTNQIDTATLITDQNRNVVWEAIMAPFGEVDVLTEAIENPLRFPGQYFDQETGLHYNYFRDYDPNTGRYIESDPGGIDGGLNTFSYAENNPIKFIDPKGEAPMCPPGQRAVPLKNYEDEFSKYFSCGPYPTPPPFMGENDCKIICFLRVPPTTEVAEYGATEAAGKLAGDFGKALVKRGFVIYGVYDAAVCWKKCEDTCNYRGHACLGL